MKLILIIKHYETRKRIFVFKIEEFKHFMYEDREETKNNKKG